MSDSHDATDALYSERIKRKIGSDDFTYPYKLARMELDYSWHSLYSKDRQRTQDIIIEKYLRQFDFVAPTTPIALFTSGGMGAGKTHLLKLFSKLSIFPLKDFVHIDPDRVKNFIPELKDYQASCPEKASSMVHHESSHIADIIMHHMIGCRYNFIVDGTLSDVDYFQTIFEGLRANGYKVIIMFVDVRPEIALNRCMLRYWDTHRFVPRDIILNSIERSKKSYHALKELADDHYHLEHNNDIPIFIGPKKIVDFCQVFNKQTRELELICESLDNGLIPYPDS